MRSSSAGYLENVRRAALGVGRITVGSGPARAVRGLVRRMGRELLKEGTYASITEGAILYPETNRLFSRE